MSDCTPTTFDVKCIATNDDAGALAFLTPEQWDKWLAAHDAEKRAEWEAEQGWQWALMAVGDDEPWSNYYRSRKHLAYQCGGLADREDERLVCRLAPGPWEPVTDQTGV